MNRRLSDLTRRELLGHSACGLGGIALAGLLQNELPAGTEQPSAFHRPPSAKRVIYLFQSGAPSQIDLFDPKPRLRERFGEELPESVRKGQRLTGMTANQDQHAVAPSKFDFAQHGECGMWLSELLPHTAQIADKI